MKLFGLLFLFLVILESCNTKTEEEILNEKTETEKLKTELIEDSLINSFKLKYPTKKNWEEATYTLQSQKLFEYPDSLILYSGFINNLYFQNGSYFLDLSNYVNPKYSIKYIAKLKVDSLTAFELIKNDSTSKKGLFIFKPVIMKLTNLDIKKTLIFEDTLIDYYLIKE